MEECPENLICFTEEELDEYGFVLDGNGEPIGDVEAASQLVWDILFLTPLELLYVGISMGFTKVLARRRKKSFPKLQKLLESAEKNVIAA